MGRIKEKMNNSNLPTHLPHNVTDTEMHSRDTNQDISKSSKKKILIFMGLILAKSPDVL